jgi:hypothetical protein
VHNTEESRSSLSDYEMSSQPEINVLKTAYIFPLQKSTRTTVSLSILDAVVTNYASCAAGSTMHLPVATRMGIDSYTGSQL